MLNRRTEGFFLLFPLYLMLFFIPIYKKIVPLFILLFIAGTLYHLLKSKNWKIDIKLSDINLWWFVLWMLGLISLLYTENLSDGFFDLQVKATMLIFPLFFSFVYVREILKKNESSLLMVWLTGILVSFLYHFGIALYNYAFKTHSMDYLFYTFLSGRFHPSYLSLYVLTAIIFVQELFIRKQLKPISQGLLMVFYFVLAIFVFLLSSKANIIALFLVSIVFLIFFIRANSKWLFPLFNIFLFVIFFVLFTFSSSIFKNRLQQAVNFSTQKNLEIAKDSTDEGGSTNDRVFIYRSSWELISENPWLGVGIGDVENELSAKYLKNNFYKGVEKKFNAHNQFLQNWIAVGLPGVMFMGLIIFNLLRRGWIKRKFTLFAFGLALLVNLMVESMLETQAGSIFIVLMSSLLMISAED